MEYLDFKGMACPMPVVKTKTHLEDNPHTTSIAVVVDNKAAVENITRFLTSRGFTTQSRDDNGGFIVAGTLTGECTDFTVPQTETPQRNTLVMVTHNTIGTGNLELGGKLMVNFIKTLPEIKDSLWRLVFVNEGVKLTVDGSEAIDDLIALEKMGVSMLVCGTCLDYFNLLERKQVGETTNMLDIMTSLQVAEKVINI